MKTSSFLILSASLGLFCASCAKQDTEAQQPIKQPAQKEASKTTSQKSKPKAATETVAESSGKKTPETPLPGKKIMPKPTVKNDSKPAPAAKEKIAKPVKKAQVPPSPEAASLFRTPADDINLPTDAEIAEGQKVSSGKTPGTSSDTAPSISIKPPAPTTGSD